MAICKCGARLRGSNGGAGRIQQCTGCGRQWPCIKYQEAEYKKQGTAFLKDDVTANSTSNSTKQLE